MATLKLEARASSRVGAEERLAADPDLGRRYDHRSPFFVDAESQDLVRMVELTRRTDGLRLQPELTFTEEETAQAPLLQLHAHKVMAVGVRDTELNQEHNDAREVRGRPPCGVRLMERFVSSKGKVPARGLVGAGQYGNEYVAGVEAALLLRDAGVDGLELRPVLTAKGEARPDAFQLFTQRLAPPVVREEGVVSRRGDPATDPEAQLLGCLVYTPRAAAAMPSDVVRTCEPFAEWQHPLWVLSARVARLLAQGRVTGFKLTPVLVAGTPLHGEYVRRWRALVDLMSLNPRNAF